VVHHDVNTSNALESIVTTKTAQAVEHTERAGFENAEAPPGAALECGRDRFAQSDSPTMNALEHESAVPSRQVPVGRASISSMNAIIDLDSLPAFLTADEAAALLRTTRKAVYTMAERGLLPGVTRLRRRFLVRRDVLLDYLRQKSTPSLKGERR
jgi:excisionase family DNA binding protein